MKKWTVFYQSDEISDLKIIDIGILGPLDSKNLSLFKKLTIYAFTVNYGPKLENTSNITHNFGR